MENLKTIDESNAESLKKQITLDDNTPKKNGIACPVCSMELFDSMPNFTLTSNPAMKNTHCTHCDYAGYRIA